MSLFPEHSPCQNSSVVLASLCNNRGTCANHTDAECVCEGQYVKDNYCLTTVREELNDANFPLYIIIAVSFAIIILLTVYDFIIDLRLKAWPSFKRPIAIGKVTLFLAALAIFFHAVIDYAEHTSNSHTYSDFASILGFCSDFLTVVTYSIATLSWISVILMAKGLGKNIKGLTVYRTYVLIANCILVPIYFVSGLLTLLFESEFITAESSIVAVVIFMFYLSLIIGTSVFVRKAFVWINSLETSHKTATTNRVKLKTYFLIGANVVASLRYLFWMVTITTANTVAKFHLYRQILNATLALFFAFMLLTLENHVVRLPLYLRTGEIKSNTFLVSSGSNTTRPAATTQSKASSRKMKSATTESTVDPSSTAPVDTLVDSRAPSISSGEVEDGVGLGRISPASSESSGSDTESVLQSSS